MTDTSPATIRIADIATTGQDRTDGPALLKAIRDALEEHGVVRLSFQDIHTLTPTLINESMVPLLEDIPIETLRTQILLVDTTRSMACLVTRCMEHGQHWNNGGFLDDYGVFDRMMRDTPRDMGITVIECRDDARDMMADIEKTSFIDLPPSGFDHRARNAAPRSYRRKR